MKRVQVARPSLGREQQLWSLGFSRVAGVDEAGRGPLAGPVVAAAVILPPDFNCPHLEHLNDSKQLTAALRDCLFDELTNGVEYGVGLVNNTAIDVLNIRQASWCAMRLAVVDLVQKARRDNTAGAVVDYVLIDGYGYGPGPWPYEAIVKGDAKSLSIAAASVLAKVTRDRIMDRLATRFPHYGFERHKGYSSPAHLRALTHHGPCPLHRRSFAPVRNLLEDRMPAREDVSSAAPNGGAGEPAEVLQHHHTEAKPDLSQI
jgi:ribonuclease HII